MDALLPTLYFGGTIVAYQGRFAPETAFALLERHRVTHAFLFPTALKAMMKAVPAPRERYRLALEGLMSAGEAVGDAVFAWCRDALGVPVNEMFGQTEMNYIVGNSHTALAGPAGQHGATRIPGHRVAVIDEAGAGVRAGHRRATSPCTGSTSTAIPDPIFFLGYWKQRGGDPAPSTRAIPGSIRLTVGAVPATLAVMDAEGYLWYQGRSDDVFKAAGYRIGPSEVENCLVKHEAVANAAVVPKPDAERGAVVKAYVVLAAGVRRALPALGRGIAAARARPKLAPYEYPKEIEFIEALADDDDRQGAAAGAAAAGGGAGRESRGRLTRRGRAGRRHALRRARRCGGTLRSGPDAPQRVGSLRRGPDRPTASTPYCSKSSPSAEAGAVIVLTSKVLRPAPLAR